MTNRTTISVNNVKKSFGNNHVLKGVNFQVDRGESLVIIGGSGCGKSVLIKCVLGLLQADTGSIVIEGTEIVGANDRVVRSVMNKISMLFQGNALFDSLPIWENVSFLLLQNGLLNRKQAEEHAIEKLRRVGLKPEVAFLYPSELSGGMQRRAALARAISHDPKIVLFDEPTTGLDPIMTSIIYELILECVREIGATAITITHDMAGARKIGDRVAMLHAGQIIWEGKAEDLDNSGNESVDQFVHGRSQGPITG